MIYRKRSRSFFDITICKTKLGLPSVVYVCTCVQLHDFWFTVNSPTFDSPIALLKKKLLLDVIYFEPVYARDIVHANEILPSVKQKIQRLYQFVTQTVRSNFTQFCIIAILPSVDHQSFVLQSKDAPSAGARDREIRALSSIHLSSFIFTYMEKCLRQLFGHAPFTLTGMFRSWELTLSF